MPNATTIARELHKVIQQINTFELVRKQLASELLTMMKEKGETRSEGFVVAQRSTLKVVDTYEAMKWAADHNVMKIDTTKAMQVVRRELTIPAGFEIATTEYLRATTPGNEDEEVDAS